MELGLTLRQAGTRLGVTDSTAINWEYGRTEPPVTSIPAIVRFLEYDPFPLPTTLAEHLLAQRRAMGWTIRQASEELGVDPGTWRDWEAGRVVLYRKHRAALAALLGLDPSALYEVMRARWNGAHARPAGPCGPSAARFREQTGDDLGNRDITLDMTLSDATARQELD
jgi:transcriptional regulator with XRE-family HTH domain